MKRCYNIVFLLLLITNITNANSYNYAYVKVSILKSYSRSNHENSGDNDFVHKILSNIETVDFSNPDPFSGRGGKNISTTINYSISKKTLEDGIDANKWKDTPKEIESYYFRHSEIVLNFEGFENDCGDPNKYEMCCNGGSKCKDDDDGLRTGSKVFPLANFNSGQNYQMIIDWNGDGEYQTYISFIWYPIQVSNLQDIGITFSDNTQNDIMTFPCTFAPVHDNEYPKYNAWLNCKTYDFHPGIIYEWQYNLIEEENVWKNLPAIGSNRSYNIQPDFYFILKDYQKQKLKIQFRVLRRTALGVKIENNNTWSFATRIYEIVQPQPYFSISYPPQIEKPSCIGDQDGKIYIKFSNIINPYKSISNYNISILKCHQDCITNERCQIYNSSCFITIPNNYLKNISNDTVFKNLSAGKYLIQINYFTENPNENISCNTITEISIPEREELNIKSSKKKYTNTNTSCHLTNDGEINLEFRGGTPPYRYSNDGINWSSLNTENAYHTINNLFGDSTYQFYFTDKFYCKEKNQNYYKNESIYLSKPDSLFLKYIILKEYQKDSSQTNANHVSCFEKSDGELYTIPASITNPQNTNGPFKINLINNKNTSTQISDETNLSLNYKTITFDNLSKGYTKIKVTDNNGCTWEIDTVLFAPQPFDTLKTDIKNNLCYGANEGEIELMYTGGTLPYFLNKITNNQSNLIDYTYTIFTDSNLTLQSYQEGSKTINRTFQINNLNNGNHLFELKDINNCVYTLSQEISSPPPIEIFTTAKNLSCYDKEDGYIAHHISGGTGKFISYNWTKDNQHLPGATNTYLSNIGIGNYLLKCYDSNHCLALKENIIYGPIKNLEGSYDIKPSQLCNSQKGLLLFNNPNGGWPIKEFSIGAGFETKMNFEIDLAKDYPTIQIRDNGNCIINLPPIKGNAINIFSIKDSLIRPNECSNDSNAIVFFETQNIPLPITFTINQLDYTISNENIFYLKNLKDGIQQITIYDQNGCVHSKKFVVKKKQKNIINYQTTYLGINTSNNKHQFNIELIPISTPFKYQLQDDTIINSISKNFIYETNTLGIKKLTLYTADNCTYTLDINFELDNLIKCSTKDPSCKERKDGEIYCNILDSNQVLNFKWSNGEIGNKIYELAEGGYDLILTKNDKSIYNYHFELKPINVILNEPIIKKMGCGNCNYYIDNNIQNNDVLYNFKLRNYENKIIENYELCPERYKIDYQFGNNCSVEKSINIPNIAKEKLFDKDTFFICGNNSLEIPIPNYLAIELFNPPKNTYDNIKKIAHNQSGKYFYRITNTEGCIDIDSIVIAKNDQQYQSSFLMASNGYIGEQIQCINISWPKTEYSNWLVDHNSNIYINNDSILSFTINEPKTYTIGLAINQGNCKDTSYKTINIEEKEVVNQKLLQKEEVINLFPNPNNGTFNIHIKDETDKIIQINIVDIYNKEIPYKTTQYGVNYITELKEAKKGNYIFKIVTTKSNAQIPFIIQ